MLLAVSAAYLHLHQFPTAHCPPSLTLSLLLLLLLLLLHHHHCCCTTSSVVSMPRHMARFTFLAVVVAWAAEASGATMNVSSPGPGLGTAWSALCCPYLPALAVFGDQSAVVPLQPASCLRCVALHLLGSLLVASLLVCAQRDASLHAGPSCVTWCFFTPLYSRRACFTLKSSAPSRLGTRRTNHPCVRTYLDANTST